MSQQLELLFLGSGNAFAPGRYWSCFLVNGRFMFDCSPVALAHLKQCDVPPDDVEAVFISHFHADHFFGLPFLLLEYDEHMRTSDFTVLGPPGIEQRVRTVVEAGYPHLLSKKKPYNGMYQDLHDGMEGQIGDLKFVARAVNHVDDFACFGFRAELSGRSVAYSGDTMMCDALLDLADGADVFVVECSCWDGACGPHLSPDDVRELRRRLGPKPTFILTHLDAGQEDLGIENVLLAQDLKRFTI